MFKKKLHSLLESRFKFLAGRLFRCCSRTTLTQLCSTGSLTAATSPRLTALSSASMPSQTLWPLSEWQHKI